MVANKRKILVTGATGQQGGALARLLLQKKHEVYALIRILNQNHLKHRISEI
jgi:nucleoside-diphosphate-sugar epimerase